MIEPFHPGRRGRLAFPIVHSGADDVDAVIATVGGEIDMATAPALVRRIEELIAGQPAAVVADLTRVSFLGSAGVMALLKLAGAARLAQVAFCVVSDQRAVLRPLHVTATDRTIVVHATLEDARAWLSGRR